MNGYIHRCIFLSILFDSFLEILSYYNYFYFTEYENIDFFCLLVCVTKEM